MNYSRDDFKLSFDKANTQFFVNEKKGIVTCVITADLDTPTRWESPVDISWRHFKGIGSAKCRPDDTFDVERGKRIALAKAENNIYNKAAQFLNEQLRHLFFFVEKITDFNAKRMQCCSHNNDYIKSIHDPAHPLYKKTVTKLKHGFTNGKPNCA